MAQAQGHAMLMEHGPEVDLVVKVSTFQWHIGLLLYEYKIMQSTWHTKVSHYVRKHSVHSTYKRVKCITTMLIHYSWGLQVQLAHTGIRFPSHMLTLEYIGS